VISFLDDGLDVKFKTILNLLGIPFLMGPLYGVFIDMGFWRKIGKIKTYVLVCPIIYCSLLVLLSFFIDQWQKDLQIWGFFGIYIMIMLSLSILMSAVDSWIATIFEEAKKPIGSYGRFIGFAFGHFTGYNIFIALSSKKFCNDYLGIEDPPWKASQFVLWIAIYCVVTMIGVMIFVAERVEVQQMVTTFSHIKKAFKQIFKKPMTKKWVFLTMFKSFGVDGILQCITTVLVKEGVKKETIVLAYSLASIPVLIGTIIITKFLKKGKMMISVYYLLWFGLALTFLDIYTYHDYITNGDGNTI
jgi:MFS family permease